MSDGIHVKGMHIPDHEIEESFHTSGGPGGQHANRSETAVRLRFRPGHSSLPQHVKDRLIEKLGDVVEVSVADERSQLRNRETARERLAEQLEKALKRPRKRKKTRRTRASNERRLNKKKARSRKKKLRKPPEIE